MRNNYDSIIWSVESWIKDEKGRSKSWWPDKVLMYLNKIDSLESLKEQIKILAKLNPYGKKYEKDLCEMFMSRHFLLAYNDIRGISRERTEPKTRKNEQYNRVKNDNPIYMSMYLNLSEAFVTLIKEKVKNEATD